MRMSLIARTSISKYAGVAALAVAMQLVAISAQAQTDAIMPPVGGPGGGQFVARCPQGQYLAGLELRAGDDIDAIRPICIIAYGPADAGPLYPEG